MTLEPRIDPSTPTAKKKRATLRINVFRRLGTEGPRLTALGKAVEVGFHGDFN